MKTAYCALSVVLLLVLLDFQSSGQTVSTSIERQQQTDEDEKINAQTLKNIINPQPEINYQNRKKIITPEEFIENPPIVRGKPEETPGPEKNKVIQPCTPPSNEKVEDESVLSFNFLYLLLQKFKGVDIIG